MNVYVIIAFETNPTLAAQIKDAFGEDVFEINGSAWLVAGSGTAKDISDRARITPAPAVDIGGSLVCSVTGYYGLAPANAWDWIRVKLEAPVNGAR